MTEEFKIYEYKGTPGYAMIHTHHITGEKGTAIGMSLEEAKEKYYAGKYEVDFSKHKYAYKPKRS